MQKVKVTAKMGYGTMSIGIRNPPVPYDEAIDLMSHVYDKYGVRVWNGAKGYQATPERTNADLFKHFFTAFPKDDHILTYKCGVRPDFSSDGSKACMDEAVWDLDEKLKSVPTRPKIVMIVGRIDKTIPIEKTVGYLKEHVDAGRIDGIGLSEASAATIKRALKVVPLSVLELEFSMFTQDIFYNDILQVASEHEIPIICYSPLARGLLTDAALDKSFLEGKALVKFGFDRFQPETFEHNVKISKKLSEFAHSKNTSLEGLAISYIIKLSGAENFKEIKKVTNLIPIAGFTSVEKAHKNYGLIIELSDGDLKTIQDILDNNPVQGLRMNGFFETALNG